MAKIEIYTKAFCGFCSRAKSLLVTVWGDALAPHGGAAWLAALLARHAPGASFRLMVGGPRESEAPGIYGRAKEVLGRVFLVPNGES